MPDPSSTGWMPIWSPSRSPWPMTGRANRNWSYITRTTRSSSPTARMASSTCKHRSKFVARLVKRNRDSGSKGSHLTDHPCSCYIRREVENRRREHTRCSRQISRRSEEHTSELQSPYDLVCSLLLEKKKKKTKNKITTKKQKKKSKKKQ